MDLPKRQVLFYSFDAYHLVQYPVRAIFHGHEARRLYHQIRTLARANPSGTQIDTWISIIRQPHFSTWPGFTQPVEYATAAVGVAGDVAQPFIAELVIRIDTSIGLRLVPYTFMQIGSARANTTANATELEQKFVRRSTINTIISTNMIGETLVNRGANVPDSQAEIPISAFPMKEPRPIMAAINRNVGQLTALMACSHDRIGSPSTRIKFIKNRTINGGMQLFILLNAG